MSDFSLVLVLPFKTSKIINDAANISIKSQKPPPFGGNFHVMEIFDHYIGTVIDGVEFWYTTFSYKDSDNVRLLNIQRYARARTSVGLGAIGL